MLPKSPQQPVWPAQGCWGNPLRIVYKKTEIADHDIPANGLLHCFTCCSTKTMHYSRLALATDRFMRSARICIGGMTPRSLAVKAIQAKLPERGAILRQPRLCTALLANRSHARVGVTHSQPSSQYAKSWSAKQANIAHCPTWLFFWEASSWLAECNTT